MFFGKKCSEWWQPSSTLVRCYVMCAISESRSLGWERKSDGIFHLKLNIFLSPIVNKYREGKMQSTLKRGLYAPATTVLQALGSFLVAGLAFRLVPKNGSRDLAFLLRSSKVRGIRHVLPMQLKELPAALIASIPSVLREKPCRFWILVSGELHFLDQYRECLAISACASVTTYCASRYRFPEALVSKGFKWPVLKHGPRSPHTCASTCLKGHVRSESDSFNLRL